MQLVQLVLNFTYSVQISIILCRGFLLKITMKYIYIILSCPGFSLVSLNWSFSRLCQQEQPTLPGWQSCPPCWLFVILIADHECKYVIWPLRRFRFGLNIFLGLYNVAIPFPWFDYYLCFCHRSNSLEEDISEGHYE